jgi:hypothetical protein
MFLAPVYDQEELAYDLIRSGACMFLGGLIIGFFVHASKYPRLTSFCHVEGVSYGGSMITIGLLISQTKYVGHLNAWELFVIWLSQIVGWPMWLSQIAQSFWGTNQMTRIVFIRCSSLSNHRSLLKRMLPVQRIGKRIWLKRHIIVLASEFSDGLLS